MKGRPVPGPGPVRGDSCPASYSRRAGLLLLCLWASCRVQGAEACIPLERIDIAIEGPLAGLATPALAAPYLGTCLDAELTQLLLGAVSSRLIEAGYVTSRPYLQEQDISDGVLEIRVLPGIVEGFVEAGSSLPGRAVTVAFLSAGEILNLQEIEDGLETLQRPPSVTASVDIRPGTRPGGSVVAISREQGKRFRSEFGANAQSALDNRLSLLIGFDNPLELNDMIELRLNDGELREALQSNYSREVAYSMGIGAWLVEASHSEIDYRQRLQGINGSFLSEGESATDLLGVSRTLARGQSYRLGVSLSLEVEDTENFLEDVRIEVSSYRTSQLRLGLRHDWYRSWGQWSNELTYHRGLDAFGARDDEFFDRLGDSASEARLQFEKWVVDSRLRYFIVAPGWYLDSALHLQYSQDILFASDKLALGSFQTVRGFASALSGSNAGYLRIDVGRQWVSRADNSIGPAAAKSIAVSAGVDYGEARCEEDNADVCGRIYGAGLGIRVRDANFSGNLLWGRPLRQDGEDSDAGDRFLLDLRWSI